MPDPMEHALPSPHRATGQEFVVRDVAEILFSHTPVLKGYRLNVANRQNRGSLRTSERCPGAQLSRRVSAGCSQQGCGCT